MRSRLFVLLLAALAVLSFVGPAGARASAAGEGASTSVIKGKVASIAAFPWLAFIEGPGFSCTGSVVAPRVVLTAGHCVQDTEGSGRIFPADGYTVTTGIADLKQRTVVNETAVAQVLVFPEYRPGENRGDAGLLILAAPVAAPPIALAGPTDGGLLDGGTPMTIAGWGLTSSGSKKVPSVLRQATLTIESPAECRKGVRAYSPSYLPDFQLCAIDRGKLETSGCSGDSGGPAIVFRADGTAVEVGVTSFGVSTCDPHNPGVFTRVDAVSGWIGSWIAAVELGAPAPPIKVPKLHLPKLSIPQAKELIYVGLGEDFKYHFRKARAGEFFGCRKADTSKVKCAIAWLQGGNFYSGTATAFLRLFHGAAVWSLRYKVSWVNERCYFDSGRPEKCVIRTRRR